MAELPAEITVAEVLDDYEALLIDAYGVLVHSGGAFPGAVEFVERLDERAIPYLIVTNDASRLPETAAGKYRRSGIEIGADRVVTSGQLVAPYFQEHDLVGARCAVLGTDDSVAYVEQAGGEICEVEALDFDVLVLGDDAGFPFRTAMDAAVTHLIRRFDAGEPVELVLPNPDLVYQQGPDSFGFATGSIAQMFEAVLQERFPEHETRFARLGKPHPPIFEEAMRRLGTDDVAMLGDQLATDIDGANRAGIDSILVTGGVTNPQTALASSRVQPDFLMESIDPSAS